MCSGIAPVVWTVLARGKPRAKVTVRRRLLPPDVKVCMRWTPHVNVSQTTEDEPTFFVPDGPTAPGHRHIPQTTHPAPPLLTSCLFLDVIIEFHLAASRVSPDHEWQDRADNAAGLQSDP